MFVWQECVRRLTGYNILMFIRDTMPFALAALAVMSLTHVLTENISNIYLLMAARIIVAAVLYFILMKTAKVKILDECIDFIMKKKR